MDVGANGFGFVSSGMFYRWPGPSLLHHLLFTTQDMSNTSTPLSSSGYASPIPISTPPTSKQIPPKAKPTNVFSNDGSFLERFQRTKKVRDIFYDVEYTKRLYFMKEEEEKKKEQEALEKLCTLP
jgi:hypothetical protein